MSKADRFSITTSELEIEGRPFPFCDRPLALTSRQWTEVSEFAKQVWAAGSQTAEGILDGVGELPEWARERYGPLLALAGQRRLRAGELPMMRLDLAWTADGQYRVLEFNTACPGGLVFASMVAEKMGADSFGLSVCPPKRAFAGFLLSELGPRIAIVTWGSDYAFELSTLVSEIESLGGTAIISDPLLDAGSAISAFRPTGLYWKSDPLRLLRDPDGVSRLVGDLPSLSPFDAMTFVEDKSFVAHVAETTGATFAPETLEATGRSETELAAWLPRERTVLKPTNLTRGEGIVIGAQCADQAWADILATVAASDQAYLLQERLHLRLDPETGLFGDLSVFVLGGEVVGAMARKSVDMIINVGRAGMLQSVVVTDEQNDAIERLTFAP